MLYIFAVYVISRFGFEGRIWVLIAPVSGHCLLGLNVFISNSYIQHMCVQRVENTYIKRGFERKSMAYRVHLLIAYVLLL